MSILFEALKQFFTEDEWPFSEIEGREALRTGFSGDSGQWRCYAQVREDKEQFIFYSVCPVNAPEAKRTAVSEFLTRANYGMIIGNFEMDFSDGEIRYKTSIDVEGSELTPAIIKSMVYANVLTMDRYLPGVMSVLYGDKEPAQAVAEIEGD